MRRILFGIARGLWRIVRGILPRSLRRAVEASPAAMGIRKSLGQTKAAEELGYWREQFRLGRGDLRRDAYYESLMRRMACLPADFSFAGLVVIDIGCGPRGSLCWMGEARLRIGVDPLSNAYRAFGVAAHPMVYVAGGAEALPFGDESVDVIVTVNALDHVDDVQLAFREIRRVLKRGGLFLGSINLREVPTATEPSVVTRRMVDEALLGGWTVEYLHTFPECDVPGDAYRYADQAAPMGYKAGMQVLWCRARKPDGTH